MCLWLPIGSRCSLSYLLKELAGGSLLPGRAVKSRSNGYLPSSRVGQKKPFQYCGGREDHVIEVPLGVAAVIKVPCTVISALVAVHHAGRERARANTGSKGINR